MNTLDISVADASAVSQARREATSLATRLGFDDVRSGQAALVASELASNLLKHGGGGRMLLTANEAGLDLLALDEGPGMADVAACVADGYSTTGTLGHGLGAVRRQSSRFGVASWPSLGTVVHAQLTKAGTADVPSATTVALVVPKPGEIACGDGWSMKSGAGHRTLLVVDGLGHGTEAAVAAREAVTLFLRQADDVSPADIVQNLHLGLRHTRGGAVAVARVHWDSRTVVYAGLGNIAGAIAGLDGSVRRLLSHNGTAGHNARKIQAFEYPFVPGSMLVMHSDGLTSHWTTNRYPGLMRNPPALIAGVLYRDNSRGRDDSTVVVSRLEQP